MTATIHCTVSAAAGQLVIISVGMQGFFIMH